MTAHPVSLVTGMAGAFLRDGTPWRRGLLVDVGSTFTKIAVVEPDGHIVDTAAGTTTIETDVSDGLWSAVDELSSPHSYDWALTCSSAAGGLRMVSVGLTTALSGKAGTLAALGAGAKVVASEAGLLDDAALERLAAAAPHLVLLAGGLDGGNEEGVLHNARQLARLSQPFGVIVAGNRSVAQHAAAALGGRSEAVRVVPNVFPRPGEIDVAPTRDAVRDLFMRHITRAKGLDGMLASLLAECEPTPLAVSRGLASTRDAPGETSVLVDVGGATTDVHSVGGAQVVHRGVDLPVPDVMRTVEGDLGMRSGAPGVAGAVGADAAFVAEAERRRREPGFLPTSPADDRIERELATAAVRIALERHAGRVVVRHTPWGDRYRVTGKDLRECAVVVATGGVFLHQERADEIIRRAIEGTDGGLGPRDPVVVIDRRYSMFAIGLVAAHSEDLATAMARHVMTKEPL